MHIVVLLRRLRSRPDGTPAARLLGACDRAALAAAIALRDQVAGARVTVLAAGPAAQEDQALTWAVAAGADAAARVDDPALTGLDGLGLARALAGAARTLAASLVLTGDRSEDEAQGALGPATAEALGIPHLTAARGLELTMSHVVAVRHDAGGVRKLRLALPCLVTVTEAPGCKLPTEPEPKPVDIRALDLAACGLAAAELRYREALLGTSIPLRLGRSATMVRDADDLLARLRDDHLVS
jgi:electron transfer flavoprotein alpha/beta subunit